MKLVVCNKGELRIFGMLAQGNECKFKCNYIFCIKSILNGKYIN